MGKAESGYLQGQQINKSRHFGRSAQKSAFLDGGQQDSTKALLDLLLCIHKLIFLLKNLKKIFTSILWTPVGNLFGFYANFHYKHEEIYRF